MKSRERLDRRARRMASAPGRDTIRRYVPPQVRRTWHRLDDRWNAVADRLVRPVLLRFRVHHVAGAKRVACRTHEVVAVCVVRAGEPYIHSFLRHHFSLGVKHVVLLLNNSVDRTEELASRYQNVTILRTSCSYARYEIHMSRFLARRFCRKGCWYLNLDIDELFDYPHSECLPLSDLITYLNRSGFNAVLAQMLDMFSDQPLNKTGSNPNDQLRSTYPLYDISAVRKEDYTGSTLSYAGVRKHRDGIRSQIFGTQNILTKAAFVKRERGVHRVDAHHLLGAKVADFTAIILHYPFVGTFTEKVEDAVASRRYGARTSLVYEQYLDTIRAAGDTLSLRQESARRLDDVASLLSDGFLVAGPAFTAWYQTYKGRLT